MFWQPFVEMVADEGLQTAETMAADVLSGRVLVCLAWNADANLAQGMAGIELRQDAAGNTICDIIWCVGHDMPEWFNLLDEIETWAKDHLGCTRIRAIHRTGWAKLLKGKGYRETHRISEKVIA